MKFARRRDYWRHLSSKRGSLSIEEASAQQLSGGGSFILQPANRLTVLCGANGAGKTSILRCIAHAVASDVENGRIDLRPPPKDSQTEVTLTFENEKHVFAQGSPKPAELTVFAVNSGDAASELRHFYESPRDIDDLLSGTAPLVLNKEELKEVSYIIGRDFSRVEVYELELSFAEESPAALRSISTAFEAVPYFRVISSGEYGTEEMGQGEIASLYLFWALRRMPRKGLLLIEEPETYLAPRSQAALLDVIAKRIDTGDFTVILTTHSEATLRQTPLANTRILFRDGGKISITTPKSRTEYLDHLGVPSLSDVIILVEDQIARAFLRSLLSACAPDLLARANISVAGDNAKIGELISHFPRPAGPFLCIGAFDGDQKSNVTTGAAGRDARKTLKKAPPKPAITLSADAWPHFFLPGPHGPEEALKAIFSARIRQFAKRIGRTHSELAGFGSQFAGLDSHDWVHELAKRLGMHVETLVSHLAAEAVMEPKFKRRLYSNNRGRCRVSTDTLSVVAAARSS